MSRLALALVLCLAAAAGCVQKEGAAPAENTVVFKHGKIAGDPARLRELLDEFERRNPGVKVKDEALPASTDEQHQFYVINLESGSPEFDVLSMDVIWVQGFARSGWLRDLSGLLPEGERGEFFPGPMEAVTFEGRVYAVPWYIDAGVLYYRKDLLEKHGFSPPATWGELVEVSRAVTEKEPGIYGFIWQGKQYEGLVCNALEFMWGNGGGVLRDGRVVLDSPQNREALRFMRDLIVKHRVSPGLVTTAMEEPTRHIFGNGKALFMRNWPYAWNIFEGEGSPVKGKTGVAPLPAFRKGEGASTLGGWQLGVNGRSRNPELAESLVRFLTSPEAQKRLALTVGYKPTRKSLYRDEDLRREQPFVASLYNIFMDARPRPVTPYYMMMTQALQPELSAAVTGIKTPEEALASAQRQVERIISGRKAPREDSQ
ncbi:MAG: ABC transporter substrate-binding protein [Thermodesulfovibrionales bacterium]